ncbi:MAG: flagellar filament capping protein FliD [Gammaproteobacteria bacterium]|nr:flagellar filament capping protein FliD [Gammaproteobacteria bacterium]MDH5694287.1 flagellar filament capping protein FliD [Gammaproteobacteria bacterium]
MAVTSSVGLGSGLNIGDLVSQLVAAEGQSKSQRLLVREAGIQARLSAIGTFKSTLSDFRSSLLNLKLASTFNTLKASSSDTKQFNATASAGAVSGSYSVEVSTLAEAHTLSTSATNAKAAITDTVGTGTLTFTFGSGTVENISITDGSLAGIRDAINGAGIGVNATLVNDGSGYRLSLKSDTGLDNEMTITATDDDGNNLDDAGLSILAYDAAGTLGNGKNMDQTNGAVDASLIVDGIVVSSASNTVTGVIDNVTLELTGITSGSAATLTISKDTGKAKKAINGFLEAYNKLAEHLNELSFYDADTKQSGVLAGDALVRNVESRMRSVLNSSLDNRNATYSSFAMLGFKTTRDGTLELDETMLDTALSEGLDEVKALLAGGIVGGDSFAADLVATYNNVPAGVDTDLLDIRISQPATQGYLENNISASFNVTGASNQIQYSINGVNSSVITLTNGGYDPANAADMSSLVSQIQAVLDGDFGAGNTTVAFDSVTQNLKITSGVYGSTSTVSVVSIDPSISTAFGLVGGSTGIIGLDVQGTIDGQAGQGAGQILSMNYGSLDGLSLTVTGGTYSLDGTIVGGTKEKGLANIFDGVLDEYLKSNGVIQTTTDGYQSQIDQINEDRAALERRLTAYEERLLKQYSAMDALVGQLNATSSYLASQLSQLPGLTNRNK